MFPIYIFLFVSVALLAFSAYYAVRHLRGRPHITPNGAPLPLSVHLTTGFVGLLVLVSTVPGLFFGNPGWLIERVHDAIHFFAG